MPLSSTSQEQLIELIVDASSISDAEKEEFVAAIESGEPSPEIISRIAKAFFGESQNIDSEISSIDKILAGQEEALAEADERMEPAARALVEEHETELKEITAAFEQDCQAADKELSEGMEEDVDVTEASEADAIRENLKKPEGEE